jgi:hypothetical protein
MRDFWIVLAFAGLQAVTFGLGYAVGRWDR